MCNFQFSRFYDAHLFPFTGFMFNVPWHLAAQKPLLSVVADDRAVRKSRVKTVDLQPFLIARIDGVDLELMIPVKDDVSIQVMSHPGAKGASRSAPNCATSDNFGNFRSELLPPRGCEEKSLFPLTARQEGPSVESPSSSLGGIDVKPR